MWPEIEASSYYEALVNIYELNLFMTAVTYAVLTVLLITFGLIYSTFFSYPTIRRDCSHLWTGQPLGSPTRKPRKRNHLTPSPYPAASHPSHHKRVIPLQNLQSNQRILFQDPQSPSKKNIHNTMNYDPIPPPYPPHVHHFLSESSSLKKKEKEKSVITDQDNSTPLAFEK
jgi:hypothetical protein